MRAITLQQDQQEQLILLCKSNTTTSFLPMTIRWTYLLELVRDISVQVKIVLEEE